MKNILVTLFFASFLLAAPGELVLPPVPEPIAIDGYAAKVNDRIITRNDVRKAMAPVIPDLYRLFQGAELDQRLDKAYQSAREQLIEKALMLEAFEAAGGQIPDHYVKEEIERIIRNQFKGDRALFEEFIMRQKKTLAEHFEEVRENIAAGMLMNEEVLRRVRITPGHIRSTYENNRKDYLIPEKIKHSVIVLNKGSTFEEQAVKREEAERILQRLLAGGDFAEAARTSSEGSRAEDGGAFSWMQPKDIRLELREEIAHIETGGIRMIETEDRLYIVKVDARRQASYQPFEGVRSSIKNRLVLEERRRLHQRWMERLKANSYIIRYD